MDNLWITRRADLIYTLTLPSGLVARFSWADLGTVTRLIPEDNSPLRLDAVEQGDARGVVRLRLNRQSPDGRRSWEITRALDGSYTVFDGRLRGTATLAGPLLSDGPGLIALGRQPLSTTDQPFTLLREEKDSAGGVGVTLGTIRLRLSGTEKLTLASGVVEARRVRYVASVATGLPKERRAGVFLLGPSGEVLRSDLSPERIADAPLQNGIVSFTDGTRWRIDTSNTALVHEERLGRAKPTATATLDSQGVLVQLYSERYETPLSVAVEGKTIRYAYPRIPPTSLSVPEGGRMVLLSSLLRPILGKRGSRQPILFAPLLWGAPNGTPGVAEVLSETSERLTIGEVVYSRTIDKNGLVTLTSTDGLRLARKSL